jgi:hypothetical protein
MWLSDIGSTCTESRPAPLMRYYRKGLITIDGVARHRWSLHTGCYEPYGDNHRSETNREFSHDGDIV